MSFLLDAPEEAALGSNDNRGIYPPEREIANFEAASPPPVSSNGRTPVAWYDLDAEIHLAADLMVARDQLPEALTVVGPDDLSSQGANLLAAIAELGAAGGPFDAGIVARHPLVANPDMRRMLDAAVTGAWRRYAQHLADLAHRRRLHHAATELAEAARTGDDGRMEQWQAELEGINAPALDARTATRVSELLPDHLDLLEARGESPELLGVLSGLTDLDEMLGGLRGGQLIIAAGRPGMGKSDLAVQLLLNVTGAGHVAVVASIEMNATELLDRYLASLSRIDHDVLRDGRMAPNDWERITGAVGTLAALPLYVIDDPGATLGSIRGEARRLTDLKLIVVDYLQLMRVTVRKDRNREQEVAELSRGLKRLARDLDVPVVALAQLNRSVEQRADKRPQLSDLRESGAIENDADVVLGLYRDDYYQPDCADKGVLEIGVLKQRAGPVGVARVAYDPARKTIKNLMRSI